MWDVRIRELNEHNTLDITTKCLLYSFITTAGRCEKSEVVLHSVTLGRSRKKFKRPNEGNRREQVQLLQCSMCVVYSLNLPFLQVIAMCNVCSV